MQVWSVGDKCMWPQCTSRAVFKTKSSSNRHITNIHTNPLLCQVQDCSLKTPFGRDFDLKRHQQSAHSTERMYICTVASCDARIKEFARKDHLTKHMREWHDNYFCPMNHCFHSTRSSFVSPEDLANHIFNEHERYECALKTCASMPPSGFSEYSLEHHLRNHHDVSGDATFSIRKRMQNRGSEKVTKPDLGYSRYRYSYCGECKTCGKQANPNKEQA